MGKRKLNDFEIAARAVATTLSLTDPTVLALLAINLEIWYQKGLAAGIKETRKSFETAFIKPANEEDHE